MYRNPTGKEVDILTGKSVEKEWDELRAMVRVLAGQRLRGHLSAELIQDGYDRLVSQLGRVVDIEIERAELVRILRKSSDE